MCEVLDTRKVDIVYVWPFLSCLLRFYNRYLGLISNALFALNHTNQKHTHSSSLPLSFEHLLASKPP